MEAKNAILCCGTETDKQEVAVKKKVEQGSNMYDITMLGAYTMYSSMNLDETIKAVFADGARMVTDYTVNPNDVHNALLVVDEYKIGLERGLTLFDTNEWENHKNKAMIASVV